MGLDDLSGMSIPDNKGGRPSKDEQEDEHVRIAEGDPHTSAKEDEDWWYQIHAKFDAEADNERELIELISQHVFINPISVRRKLQQYDIYETDWEELIEKYPMYKNDARIPGNELNSSGTAGMSSRLDDVFGGSSSSSNDDDDISGGLSSLMQ